MVNKTYNQTANSKYKEGDTYKISKYPFNENTDVMTFDKMQGLFEKHNKKYGTFL